MCYSPKPAGYETYEEYWESDEYKDRVAEGYAVDAESELDALTYELEQVAQRPAVLAQFIADHADQIAAIARLLGDQQPEPEPAQTVADMLADLLDGTATDTVPEIAYA